MEKKIYIKNINTKIIIKNKFISKYLLKVSKKNKKIFCIVDKNVKYLLKDFKYNKNIIFIYLNAGENIKNFKHYYMLCEKILSNQVDRSSVLISIGGGTIGDLCGFVASTMLRGIDYRLIPTTLLSQVDSSIGGKNGINSFYGKNLIGTFYHPSEVIIDTDVLRSLPKRELKSGYSEIVKHSLINDSNLFKWLEKNYSLLFRLNTKVLEETIYRSLMIKLHYVTKDPLEKLINSNSRSMLNFGHTIGHSLEAYYKYKKKLNHGEAISIGMMVESFISNKLGYLSSSKYNKIIDHFKKVGLKNYDNNIKNNKIIDLIKKDKKNTDNKINIVLLKDIGKSFFNRNMKLSLIKKIIKNI